MAELDDHRGIGPGTLGELVLYAGGHWAGPLDQSGRRVRPHSTAQNADHSVDLVQRGQRRVLYRRSLRLDWWAGHGLLLLGHDGHRRHDRATLVTLIQPGDLMPNRLQLDRTSRSPIPRLKCGHPDQAANEGDKIRWAGRGKTFWIN